MITREAIYECDACPADDPTVSTGYERRELEDDGWLWCSYRKRTAQLFFVMCPRCVNHYAKRRKLRAQLEAAAT